MDEFDWLSQWWLWSEGALPDLTSATPSATGKLSYSAEHGSTLEVLMQTPPDAVLGPNEDLPMAVGVLADGRYATLVGLMEVNRAAMLGSSLMRRSFAVSEVYVGLAFNSLEEMTFAEARIGLSSLGAWLSDSPFVRDVSRAEGRMSFSISYQPPEHGTAYHDQATIGFGESFSDGGDGFERRLTRNPFVRIAAHEPMPFPSLVHDLARPLTCLLTLATRAPVEIAWIELAFRFPSEGTAPGRLHNVQVWINPVRTTQGTARRPEDFLFRAGDAPQPLEEFLIRWFDLYAKLRPLIDMYVAAHAALRSFIEQKFHYAVAVAEGMHREFNPPSSAERKKFEDSKARALAACPLDLQQWLEARIGESPEVPLWRRISELCFQAPCFEPFIPLKRRRYRLLSRIVASRNVLFHGKNVAHGDRMSGEQSYWAIEMLLFAVEWTLLRELGFDPDSLGRLFESNRSFVMARQEFARTVA